MKNIYSGVCSNIFYFTGYFLFAVLLSLFCISFGKAGSFLFFNQLHSRFLDYFFILFTNIGNGLFVIGIMLFMLMRKKTGWSLQIGISFLGSGLVVQILKHMMPSPRPKLFFGSQNIHCIYGITRTGSSSFPSGHTATIFALTALLCIYFPGRKSGLFFLAIAILTGFSRIYLSQHFPVDVLAGSITGVAVSLLTYQFIPLKRFEKRIQENEYGPQSIKLR